MSIAYLRHSISLKDSQNWVFHVSTPLRSIRLRLETLPPYIRSIPTCLRGLLASLPCLLERLVLPSWSSYPLIRSPRNKTSHNYTCPYYYSIRFQRSAASDGSRR